MCVLSTYVAASYGIERKKPIIFRFASARFVSHPFSIQYVCPILKTGFRRHFFANTSEGHPPWRVPYLKRKKRNPYRITLLSVCPSVRPSVKTLFLRNAWRATVAALGGGARRRRRRRPPTASRLKGPRKQKRFAYKLLKRGLANLMSPTSTSGVAPPLKS
ncbi:hypothetical protein EVAR_65254_1 [Eumeta japonica]|uniref:Uncharacterized protein n=1 Tax=Eumeta variegata TaxID=151549 RepID=A0A4C1ZUU5_EUMVA|nr:hypothetical protein EVAR_65254_1 [Eumeta japonica]